MCPVQIYLLPLSLPVVCYLCSGTQAQLCRPGPAHQGSGSSQPPLAGLRAHEKVSLLASCPFLSDSEPMSLISTSEGKRKQKTGIGLDSSFPPLPKGRYTCGGVHLPSLSSNIFLPVFLYALDPPFLPSLVSLSFYLPSIFCLLCLLLLHAETELYPLQYIWGKRLYSPSQALDKADHTGLLPSPTSSTFLSSPHRWLSSMPPTFLSVRPSVGS